MAGISSKAAGSLNNKLEYNGYEFNSDFGINLYESFYRLNDPQIGRFWQVDPKSTDIESLYAAMRNNPVKNFDLLGDEVEIGKNTEGSKRYKRKSENKLLDDLRAKTGLDLGIKNGKLINYGVSTNNGVSMTARAEILLMIGTTNTINVDFSKTTGSQVLPDNRNQIILNTNDIDYRIDHTSKDLNNTTMGYAMSLFHENGHTPNYGNFSHDNSKGGTLWSGGIDAPDILGNVIRNELTNSTGENYGQRLAYLPMTNNENSNKAFIPFSTESKVIYDQMHVQINKTFSLPPGKREPEMQKLKAIPLPKSGIVFVRE